MWNISQVKLMMEAILDHNGNWILIINCFEEAERLRVENINPHLRSVFLFSHNWMNGIRELSFIFFQISGFPSLFERFMIVISSICLWLLLLLCFANCLILYLNGYWSGKYFYFFLFDRKLDKIYYYQANHVEINVSLFV